MRLGIFGGSFDPVHIGHVQLVVTCRDQVPLDKVWLMPAARQPFKLQGPHATDDQRCAMLGLAIADQQRIHVSRIEIDRSGVSFTVDTLREIAVTQPHDDLFLLLGADTLADLPSWREAEVICRLATPIVVSRAGEAPVDFDILAGIVPTGRTEQIRKRRIDMPPVDVSSSVIRRRIADGGSIAGMVPPAVADFIIDRGLYQGG